MVTEEIEEAKTATTDELPCSFVVEHGRIEDKLEGSYKRNLIIQLVIDDAKGNRGIRRHAGTVWQAIGKERHGHAP